MYFQTFKKSNYEEVLPLGPFHKVNYRPANILPIISKVFEKLIHKQISGYISNYPSPYLRRYRKGFISYQALLPLVENRKKILDKKIFGEAVLMDLSNVFDTIKHDLLIAKLYGVRNF